MSETKIKECFVIMPISNNTNYSDGHFDRVYYYLIVPACELAGFKAVRADEIINTNYIALDIIKRIIESEMAICDLSSQNPNVLYELGIRQAFNKPVTLLKDKNTKRIFDIQGFRDFEYDSTLRIDNVQIEVENLAELIQNTYKSQGEEINSLVSLLSITPAKLKENKKISSETELILNSLSILNNKIAVLEKNNSKNRYLYELAPNEIIEKNIEHGLPSNVGGLLSTTEIALLRPNDIIFHKRFGFGKILSITTTEGTAKNRHRAEIEFEIGTKYILLEMSEIRRVL